MTTAACSWRVHLLCWAGVDQWINGLRCDRITPDGLRVHGHGRLALHSVTGAMQLTPSAHWKTANKKKQVFRNRFMAPSLMSVRSVRTAKPARKRPAAKWVGACLELPSPLSAHDGSASAKRETPPSSQRLEDGAVRISPAHAYTSWKGADALRPASVVQSH